MPYSIKPRDVKEYGLSSFAKKNEQQVQENQYKTSNFLIVPKIYNRYNNSCFKESNSKKAEASGVLIGYKITDKYKKYQK